jgi:DnaJ family protein C protein 17
MKRLFVIKVFVTHLFFYLFQLSQALTVLTDPEARKAYDNVLKAKQATQIRHQQLDAKRQKLKEQV